MKNFPKTNIIIYSPNKYAKIFGTVRSYKDEKVIVGTHIKNIEKYDEVTNHLLQVFVASQMRKKGVLSVSINCKLNLYFSNKTLWLTTLANKPHPIWELLKEIQTWKEVQFSKWVYQGVVISNLSF